MDSTAPGQKLYVLKRPAVERPSPTLSLNYAEELNPQQLAAVEAVEGPALVIAGAGSGKTRTLVYRVARLIDIGINPASILLLTFTRKSAQEMLDALRSVLRVIPEPTSGPVLADSISAALARLGRR